MALTVPEIVLIAGVTGLISLLFQTFFYFAIHRRERNRDNLVNTLSNRVQSLETDKIEDLKETIERVQQNCHDRDEELNRAIIRTARRREKIYKRLEEDVVSRRDFIASQERIAAGTSKVENRLVVLASDVALLGQQVAKSSGFIELLAAHLQIKLNNGE